MQKNNWLRVIGVVALVWNAIGAANYLAHVGVIGGGGPPGDNAMPPLITAAFAIGVFAGVAGGLAMALLSRWARPLLWLSWIGTVIDWVWVLRFSDEASVPLGATILVAATLFVVAAEWQARGTRR